MKVVLVEFLREREVEALGRSTAGLKPLDGSLGLIRVALGGPCTALRSQVRRECLLS